MTVFKVLEYDSDPRRDGKAGKAFAKRATASIPCNEYIISTDETRFQRVRPSTSRNNSNRRNEVNQWIKRILHVGADVFLPIDWPHSVGPNYLQYQVYDSIQGLSSYLRGVVSTSAVLQAAGVGSSSADAMSAAVVSVSLFCLI